MARIGSLLETNGAQTAVLRPVLFYPGTGNPVRIQGNDHLPKMSETERRSRGAGTAESIEYFRE